MPFADVGPREVHYELTGDGPPLVLVMGLGGDSTALHPLPIGSAPGAVVYSTVQTIGRRLSEGHRLGRPGVVVWDECHWGEHGQIGRDLLRWCRAERIPVLGLTATPRPCP